MSEITKPIALDETLQRVATALESIEDHIKPQGERIVLNISASEALPSEYVHVQVLRANNNELLFEDYAPVGVDYELKEKVDSDTEYYIFFERFSQFHAPHKEIHRAVNAFVRHIPAHYEHFHHGVFICTEDKRLFSTTDWRDGLGVPYAIYFSDADVAFLIALDNISGTKAWAKSGTTEATQFLPADESRKRANNWLGGVEDCQFYLDNYSLANMPALEAVRTFKWSSGTVDPDAYLPSIGELVKAAGNLAAINECLATLGKDAWILNSGGWWSSSQYAATFAWLLYNGNPSYYNRTNASSVRAFSAF